MTSPSHSNEPQPQPAGEPTPPKRAPIDVSLPEQPPSHGDAASHTRQPHGAASHEATLAVPKHWRLVVFMLVLTTVGTITFVAGAGFCVYLLAVNQPPDWSTPAPPITQPATPIDPAPIDAYSEDGTFAPGTANEEVKLLLERALEEQSLRLLSGSPKTHVDEPNWREWLRELEDGTVVFDPDGPPIEYSLTIDADDPLLRLRLTRTREHGYQTYTLNLVCRPRTD